MGNWIDFKELRERLSFADVLRHYGVELKGSATQQQFFCPLPNHNGRRRSPSFSANIEKGLFRCFGCGAKGNLIDFAVLMERADPKDGTAVRTVALKLAEAFRVQLTAERQPQQSDQSPRTDSREGVVKSRVGAVEGSRSVLVNPPLDFELKDLDRNHPYLRAREFLPETVEHFGLGVARRGALQNHLAIPLHAPEGVLVGYASRVLDDKEITENNPRYRFPGPRERNGQRFVFQKSQFLYNEHRFVEPLDDLIVVEGFTAVWWLYQAGFTHVVALMGSDCSQQQANSIRRCLAPRGRLWILPDGDEPGSRCAASIFEKMIEGRFCRWVRLPRDSQPTDLEPAQLAELLGE